MAMPTNPNNKNYIPLAILAIVALIALVFLMQKPATTQGSVSEIVENAGDSLKKTGRDMDPNRTTGEKIGDAVEDAGDDIQNATDGE